MCSSDLVRRAAALRPDWEAPAIFEAQLLQRRSAGEAARRLADFLDKNPGSRDVRINYARLLVMDRRPAEARAQLEDIARRFENDPDALYTVGLLALQSKEHGVAESSLKRVLTLKFRDPDAALYALGQVAEERRDWAGAIEWYKKIEQIGRAHV